MKTEQAGAPRAGTGRGAPDTDLLSRCQAVWYELDDDPPAACASARSLVALAERAGDVRAAAYARCAVAWSIGQDGGEVAEGLDLLDRIETVLGRLDDPALRLRWHCAAAIVLGAMGDRSARFDHLEQMRIASLELDDVWHELVALHDMALHFERDDLLDAALARAEAVSGSLTEPRSVLVSLLVRSSERLAATGRLGRAEQQARRALTLAREDGLSRWQAYAFAQLGLVLALAGRAAEALAASAEAEHATALLPAHRWLGSARVHQALGHVDHAVGLYEQILDEPGCARSGGQAHLDAARDLAPMLAATGAWRRAYEVQVLYEQLRSRIQAEEDTRRLRGLEVLHRVALARQLAEEEQARSRHLADDVARLERLHRELAELAEHDVLTGLYNRRRAEAELAGLVESVGAGAERASVAILDADHFKRVNDRHGHAVGDEVLRRLAVLIQQELRGADVAARFGGEEFVLLLPATELDDAHLACERLRVVVETHPWEVLADGLTVTVSIGVAEVDPVDGPDGVLAVADTRLYAAKRAGRNRVCS